MRNLQEQVKKDFVTKNCSDLLLFEQIVLEISKFLDHYLEHFFLAVGQNNFGNKIQLFLIVAPTEWIQKQS